MRRVAETAGVSPGLVIHYFGSKDGLRTECEKYVGDRIHEAIEQATADLQPYDLVVEMSRKVELAALVPYLLRALAEGGDLGRRMFGRVVDDTERYLKVCCCSGCYPSVGGRACSCGNADVLQFGFPLLAQYLVTAESPEHQVEELQRRFAVPALEVFTQGLYTSTELADRFRDQFRQADAHATVGSPGRSTVPNRTLRRVTRPSGPGTSSAPQRSRPPDPAVRDSLGRSALHAAALNRRHVPKPLTRKRDAS